MWQGKAGSNIKYSGIPFQIVGKKVLECHHGPDRNKSLKRKYYAQKVP